MNELNLLSILTYVIIMSLKPAKTEEFKFFHQKKFKKKKIRKKNFSIFINSF